MNSGSRLFARISEQIYYFCGKIILNVILDESSKAYDMIQRQTKPYWTKCTDITMFPKMQKVNKESLNKTSYKTFHKRIEFDISVEVLRRL